MPLSNLNDDSSSISTFLEDGEEDSLMQKGRGIRNGEGILGLDEVHCGGRCRGFKSYFTGTFILYYTGYWLLVAFPVPRNHPEEFIQILAFGGGDLVMG